MDLIRWLASSKCAATACDHAEERGSTTYEITKDTDVIQSIHRAFKEPDFDPSPILYRLAAMKIIGDVAIVYIGPGNIEYSRAAG
jgi:hypothetical protein